jgi:glycosyltransferase involved in cell wall biosynthesis
MKRQALVSVVVPTYNGGPFLEEAIESVSSQSYGSWELLLVDDGSTDGSDAIARRYARTRPERIVYLEHPGHANRGASESRNLAIRHARGQYIALLDADDVWAPDKLEQQVRILDAHPDVAATYGPLEFWYSWNPTESRRDFLQDLHIAPGVIVPPTLLELYVSHSSATPGTSALLVRADAVRAVGGFQSGFRSLYDDQVLYAKLSLEFPMHVDGASYSKYRRHPAAMMAIANSQGPPRLLEFRIQFLTWLEEYISARGLGPGKALAAVQAELWRYRHPVLHRQYVRLRRLAAGSRRLLGFLNGGRGVTRAPATVIRGGTAAK